MSTSIERIADFAAGLSWSDAPAAVIERCRAQRRSVLGAVGASANDDAAGRVLAALGQWAADGPAPLLGTGRTAGVEDAVYAAAALSIALDFDDYLCFAHTGHSAVLVPLLLAAETGRPGRDQLLAQLVANEVGGRLGGACLIGPQNGQLWSFVHAAGAALAAGRLLGLRVRQLAHALAIALYQAPRPTVPGFMAPDSKLLTAAEPAAAGLRAARLAAAGATGPLDVLDHPQGFLAAFADAPLPAMLGGLGETWVTSTLCVKPYPGCAYVDTVVDALLELGPPPAAAIERVTVEASLLSCAMDALSAPYASAVPPTPVTVNFSLPWTVAVTLLAGELTPASVHSAWLADHHEALSEIVDRTRVGHDWALTRDSAESFAGLLPPGRVVRDAGLMPLGRGIRRLRSEHRGVVSGLGDLRGIGALLAPAGQRRGAGRTRHFWDADALESFAMTFPARVRLRFGDGRELVATARVPRGGAGHPHDGPEPLSRAKLARWGSARWGASATASIAAAIDADDDRLWALLEEEKVARPAPEPPREPSRGGLS